jgi:hypothetical protein
MSACIDSKPLCPREVRLFLTMGWLTTFFVKNILSKVIFIDSLCKIAIANTENRLSGAFGNK